MLNHLWLIQCRCRQGSKYTLWTIIYQCELLFSFQTGNATLNFQISCALRNGSLLTLLIEVLPFSTTTARDDILISFEKMLTFFFSRAYILEMFFYWLKVVLQFFILRFISWTIFWLFIFNEKANISPKIRSSLNGSHLRTSVKFITLFNITLLVSAFIYSNVINRGN